MQPFYVKSKRIVSKDIGEGDLILVLEIAEFAGEVKLLVVDNQKSLWYMNYSDVIFVGLAEPKDLMHKIEKEEHVQGNLDELVAPAKKPFGRK